MALWSRCSWIFVVLLYGFGLSSALVRPRRQSEPWWRSQQRGLGSSRAHGHPESRADPWSRVQPVSGLGAPRALQPVSGWGSRYPAGQSWPRQLLPPTPPPSPLTQSPSSPIRVQCGEEMMVVMVSRDFYGTGFLVNSSDFSLGSCSPGPQSNSTVVVFNNNVQACGSRLQVTPDYLIYSIMLDYNPVHSNTVIVRASPAMVPIQCYYPRYGNVSSGTVMPMWAPFSATVSTEERLAFSMYLMTDDWSSRRTSLIYQLGDVLNIEASVDTYNHIPMILFVDYCVATPTSNVNSTPSYDLIAYNGCLVDGTQVDASSAFRSPRSQLNVLQFMVDAFLFSASDTSTIYITCNLKAVQADQPPDPMNKACSYNKATGSWSALEGSNDICSCCASKNCATPIGQSRLWGNVHGGSRRIGKRETGVYKGLHPEERATATLGPLLVINADKHYMQSMAERLQASLVPEESESSELRVLVVVGALSLVVVSVSLFVLGNFIWKKLSPQEAQK